MKRSVSWRLALGLGVAAWAVSATALDSIGVLAVAPPPGPTPELASLTRQFRRALLQRDAGVLDADRLRAKMVGPTPVASLADLQRAYDVSVASDLSRGDDEKALVKLTAILTDLDRLPPSQEAFALWIRATASLARVESDLGDMATSNEVLTRLVRRAPEVRLSDREYGAKFLRRVEEAKALLRAAPTARLVVSSPTAGVRVFVDGRDVGETPVNLTLPVGPCTILGIAGAIRMLPRSVSLVEGDAEIVLDFSIPGSLRPDSGPGVVLPGAMVANEALAVGAYLGLDQVVTVRLATEFGAQVVTTTMYDVRRGAYFERQAKVPLVGGTFAAGGAEALAESLLGGARASGLVRVPDAAGPPAAGDVPIARPETEARATWPRFVPSSTEVLTCNDERLVAPGVTSIDKAEMFVGGEVRVLIRGGRQFHGTLEGVSARGLAVRSPTQTFTLPTSTVEGLEVVKLPPGAPTTPTRPVTMKCLEGTTLGFACVETHDGGIYLGEKVFVEERVVTFQAADHFWVLPHDKVKSVGLPTGTTTDGHVYCSGQLAEVLLRDGGRLRGLVQGPFTSPDDGRVRYWMVNACGQSRWVISDQLAAIDKRREKKDDGGPITVRAELPGGRSDRVVEHRGGLVTSDASALVLETKDGARLTFPTESIKAIEGCWDVWPRQ